MSARKIAITIDQEVLKEVDALVKKRVYPSRSRAVQDAVKEKLERLNHYRLAEECNNLDPNDEKAIAEEGLSKDISEWPEF